MLDLSAEHDPALEQRRLAALRAEYDYWMAGAACLDASAAPASMSCGCPTAACSTAIGTRAIRRATNPTPRTSQPRKPPRRARRSRSIAICAPAPKAAGISARAGCAIGKTLATIHTTDIVPVDLNSLMWAMERAIARRCRARRRHRLRRRFHAQRRTPRMRRSTKYLWVAKESRFADWDRTDRARRRRCCRRRRSIPCSSALRRPQQAASGGPDNRGQTARAGRPAHHAQPHRASNGMRPTAGRRCNGSPLPGWTAMAPSRLARTHRRALGRHGRQRLSPTPAR